ncbi:adenylate kinase isoenzyme 5 isoform X2 [Topomyia yanbarensis]|uniref:adenylate kinase isoenzyme 5 isoform X2 n=1 Tax=Topomyia yanbarensis TaxID=2498891 RepID=UPI00273A86B4|nr:adenylate kinase isoenzyme 5 isoform X2 [Topomyia yanbarensis]
MGICLDTDKSNTVQEVDESDWKGGGRGGGSRLAIVGSPSLGGAGINPANGGTMQNTGKVKFDPPKVPVIFVLGGPGSGKVTHCDTLMQERRGVTHINMMDLLQQYAIGNDMQDFSQLSSRTVTDVLMLEMKMSPAAKTYLVSGYPRSMRDVVEYSEKIQVINGVILISWRQTILQRQIDYGAKLGHVVLSLAKMELENFFKNVMPVADYFDQSDMLIAINGERAPSEVYKDFRAAVLDILGAQENQEALLNGVAGMGRGVDDIPGSIVSVETAPSQNKVIAAPAHQVEINNRARSPTPPPQPVAGPAALLRQQSRASLGMQLQPRQDSSTRLNVPTISGVIPPIIWVIGGPGSNKATLCLKAVGTNPGWGHFSVGRLLRAIAESDPRLGTDNYAVKEAITAGEMVPKKSLERLLEAQLSQLHDKRGVIIDGYPRDMEQVGDFEEKYNQKPPIILLDCSKLQLGRGRLDDTVSSFRRRLELFRELTLPMLKEMDTAGRLTIVDGDTDSPTVQREFERIVRDNIQKVLQDNTGSESITPVKLGSFKSAIQQARKPDDAIVHDLDADVPGVVPTISHHVSLANGHLGGGVIPTGAKNGYIPNGRPNFRNMLEEADNFDSHM